MQKELIIAGFGGQGVLFGGQVVAYAAMDAGKEVTWIPSYGPEMRGGTANCTVVIADEEIGSPLVEHPALAVALNLPSFDKYEEILQKGGTLIVNQSMVDRKAKRSDDSEDVGRAWLAYMEAGRKVREVGKEALADK